MKSLLKGLVPVSCFLLTVPLASAQSGDQSAPPPPPPAEGQPPPPPGPGGQGWGRHRRDPISEVSNLTDAQKAQIKALRKAMREKIDALADDDDKREARREIMQATSSQIRALLTPDQQAQYDAAVKKMMHGHRAPPPDANGQPPPPPDAEGQPPAPPPPPAASAPSS